MRRWTVRSMVSADPGFIGPPSRKVRGLSWGALVFAPFWLLRNGFWMSAVVYVVCAIYVWPASLIIGILFFIFGARWSWGQGNRWHSYEQFVHSKFSWDFLALVAMSALTTIALAEILIEP